MARSFSLLLVLAVSSAAWGQAFGRFGYTEEARVPGFVVGKDGFRVRQDAADLFRFDSPRPLWRPLATSEFSQMVGLGEGARVPSKLRADLLNPGFSLYFGSGFRLRLSSLSAPFLSWQEGSVGTDVPTPPARWVLLSFRDAQPPVLFVFQDAPASLTLTGRAGDWSLEADGLYQGWVRIVAPVGSRTWATHSAADLGRLVKLVLAEESVWLTPPVSFISREVEDEPTGVVCTWRFDRAGAIVPPAATLAVLGGHPVRVLSRTRRLEGVNEEGPVTVAEEAELKIRFPVRRIPTGRALAIGNPGMDTASGDALEAAVRLALRLMLAQRGGNGRPEADERIAAFLSGAPYETERFTGQKLPFAAGGAGLDSAAGYALLMQAIYTSERATSEPNSLLTSVVWRRDWNSWTLATNDATLQRRGGALAALAGALCPEAERRLEGALFQAGLSAQRGLAVWQRRRGEIDEDPKLLEIMEPLRAALFSLEGERSPETQFLRMLQSDIRLSGVDEAWIERSGEDLMIVWPVETAGAGSLILTSAYPLQVEAGENLAHLETIEALGFTQIRYRSQGKGVCKAKLILPAWAGPLPEAVSIPRYSETYR